MINGIQELSTLTLASHSDSSFCPGTVYNHCVFMKHLSLLAIKYILANEAIHIQQTFLQMRKLNEQAYLEQILNIHNNDMTDSASDGRESA